MLKPKIKEHLDIFPTGADTYQVRGGAEYLSVLKGNTAKYLLPHLLPLLNGEYTTDQLVEQLDGVAPPSTIKTLILKLESSGLLEDAAVEETGALSSQQAALYQNQVRFFRTTNHGVDGARCQKALLNCRISVVGSGELAKRISLECAQVGVGKVDAINVKGQIPSDSVTGSEVIETGRIDQDDLDSLERRVAASAPPLLVLALDSPRPGIMDRINRLSQDMKIPLLHSAIRGKEGIVGPLVAPGKTACLMCHHLRVIRNGSFYDEYIQWERWIETEGKRKHSPSPSLGPFTGIIAGMAALEVVKKVTSFYEPALYGKFLAVNAMTLEVIPHRILRVPRCPGCGKLRDRVAFAPWTTDERDNSRERVSDRHRGHTGENGASC
jgi:bacteriocin biosynthesis cyclodehydratase domain-containing protein